MHVVETEKTHAHTDIYTHKRAPAPRHVVGTHMDGGVAADDSFQDFFFAALIERIQTKS